MFLQISSASTVINLAIDQKWGEELLKSKFLYQYIPEVSIKRIKSPDLGLSNVEIQCQDSFSLSFDGKNGVVQYNIKETKNLYDVITLIEYYFEYLRQKDGIYCFHGSAASLLGRGLLLFGPVSGLGKTTLALDLCLNHKFNFIGDEKILLSAQMKLLGGIKSIKYNKDFLNQSLSFNLNNKSEQELSEVIKIENKQVKVSLIVLPIVIKGSKSLEIEKWDQTKCSFHLYEEMTRKVRGVSRRIFNYSTPVKSLDDDSIWQRRSDFSKQLSEEVPGYLLKGGLSEIENGIIEIMRGLE